jgi:hypothetical protein
MNKVLQWMMATVAVSFLTTATGAIAADPCAKQCVPATEKVTTTTSVIHDKVPVTTNVPITKTVKRTKWVAIQRPVYKLVKKGVYAKKTVTVQKKVLAKKTEWVDRPRMVETRIVEKPIVIERRILVERPIVYTKDSSMVAAPVAVDTNACAAPAVVTDACGVAAPTIINRREHFLRFGLGPIIDLGIL